MKSALNTMLLIFTFILLWIGMPETVIAFGQVSSTSQVTVQGAERLIEGQKITKQVAGSRKDIYKIDLKARQFLQLVIDQNKLDVATTIFNPEKRQLVSYDTVSDFTPTHPERVCIVTEVEGEYVVEVSATFDANTPAGEYSISIEELRPTVPEDSRRLELQKGEVLMTLAEGEKQAAPKEKDLEKSKAQYKAALQKYGDALQIWKNFGLIEKQALTYLKISGIHFSLGDLDTSESTTRQAIKLWKEVENNPKVIDTYFNLGTILIAKGKLNEEALNSLLTAKQLSAQFNRIDFQIETSIKIGEYFMYKDDFKKARASFEEALKLSRSLPNDKKFEMKSLNVIGSVDFNEGNFKEALNNFKKASSFLSTKEISYEHGFILRNLGKAFIYNDDQKNGWKYLEISRKIFEMINNQPEIASTLEHMGDASLRSGEVLRAINFFDQAKSQMPVQFQTRLIPIYYHLGVGYLAIGNTDSAIKNLIECVNLCNSSEYLYQKALAYISLGVAENFCGNYNLSSLYFKNAEETIKSTNNERTFALFNNDLGFTYYKTNKFKESEDCLNKARNYFEKVNDFYHLANVLSNLGLLEIKKVRNCKTIRVDEIENKNCFSIALEKFQKALDFVEKIDNKRFKSLLINNIGLTYRYIGDYEKAYSYYIKIPDIMGDSETKTQKGSRLNNLGVLSFYLKENSNSLMYLNEALSLAIETKNRSQEAAVYYNLANTYHAQRNLQQAKTNIEKSLEIIESLRFDSGPNESRTEFFEPYSDYYRFYVSLLMEMHQANPEAKYQETAFVQSEHLRARTLLELFLARFNRLPVNLETNENVRLVNKLIEIEQNLAAKQRQKSSYSSLQGITTKDQENLESEIRRLSQEYQEALEVLKQNCPVCNDFIKPEFLSVSRVQKELLDADTMVLEYALSGDKSYLFILTSTSYDIVELPSRNVIEGQVHEFLSIFSSNLNAPATSAPQVDQKADALSTTLFGHSDALPFRKNIYIVPDGNMALVPFGLLTLPGQKATLLEKCNLTEIQSVTLLGALKRHLKSRPTVSGKVAILADPVFKGANSETLSSGKKNKLPSISLKVTNEQIETLRKHFADDQMLVLQGTDARQENVVDPARTKLGDYQVVIFATHGTYVDGNLWDSGLVLPRYNEKNEPIEGLITLYDIIGLKLPVEMVVLSACSSGAGQPVNGEGLVGITRGFMIAGAKMVVANLWETDREVTTELMKEFYDRIFNSPQKMKPSEALREAQKAIQKKGYVKGVNVKHPRFWAGWVIQGLDQPIPPSKTQPGTR